MRSIATFPLAALCGLVMVASLFLSWVQLPGTIAGADTLEEDGAAVVAPEVSGGFTPFDLISDPGFSIDVLFQDPMGIAVALSFVLAAAIAVLGFLGGTVPRLFAIIGGILPFGIVGYGYFQAREQLSAFAPIPDLGDVAGVGDVQGIWGQLQPFVGPGMYAYFGGALLLLVLGLFSPSKREYY